MITWTSPAYDAAIVIALEDLAAQSAAGGSTFRGIILQVIGNEEPSPSDQSTAVRCALLRADLVRHVPVGEFLFDEGVATDSHEQ
ncbi:hypothetical protein [Amycolatopsis panacis]|uniref:hypothetical protein n=1 Tax=Amycolatopsis panacis TaxID=2340917 RepID=UPI001F407ACD|nr:hypothetical protein [Amycolatopsis panacis]